MCGICGKVTIDKQKPVNADVIHKMAEALKHRGPDNEGIYIDVNIGMGHRRLSIIDLSSAAHQPMSNEDKTVWIVCNGEIYNFQELRDLLKAKGHVFCSHSDTEVIIHLYEEFGEACVEKLRGMFAFAIWDKKKQVLFLARDRVGQKPLNYVLKNGELIFSSEIQSILEDPSVGRDVNIESLHNYLTYQYVPIPETMFKGINKLPPAHTLIWKEGKIKIKKYWNLDFSSKLCLTEDEYCQRILDALSEATKIRLMSDVSLGAFLSGGIDSSAIVAMMSKFSNKPVKTFSIGFEETSFNELEYARVVAKTFNTEHKEYIVKADALSVLPKLIERFGEPFADSSSIPTYYLSQMTRQDVTVALNGDAGDELFAGYERYAANKLANYYRLVPRFLHDKVIFPLITKIPESAQRKDFALRIKRFIEPRALSKEKRYAWWMSTFNNELKEKMYSSQLQDKLKGIDSHDYLLDVYKQSQTKDFVDSTLFVDTMTYLPNDLLVKVDITSMANSLEARSPFLDHKLMELVARIPSEFKLKGLTTKYILRKTFSKLLPKQILKRKKAGFGVPVGKWFRNEMKKYAYEVLLDQKALKRNYFKEEAIKSLLDEHVSGKKDHGQRIWTLINLELWNQRFIDN